MLPPAAVFGVAGCRPKIDPGILRFGHFPNVTHVQGLVAHQLSRRGEGWFEKRLGVKIEWFTYNAGPSATEAIFSGSLDVTYIGPSPVLNAYAKSAGDEMRVLAGAAYGGNSLVVRADSGITKPEDFRGKKIATPQLGNTQDVQTRAWLAENGIKVTLTGGEAMVLPTENSNQFALFQNHELDAVWTVEPWVTRLELDAGGKIFFEDKNTSVTLLAAS
ncbi:MAG: ABC transporter substrate-binding protein, partial [Verrucomicrobiaceae bacterium]